MTFALGAELYFDTELFLDPSPFVALAAALFDDDDADVVQFFVPIGPKKGGPSKQYDPATLAAKIRAGGMWSAFLHFHPDPPDADLAELGAKCRPRATMPANEAAYASKYNADVTLGAARLAARGAAHVVDAIVTFADRVNARAGVVRWAQTAKHAAIFATGSGSHGVLSAAQERRLDDEVYWRSRFGEIARGPAWGTFLDAAHVETLGGVARIERESGCARVVRLAAGGAFLQATAIDDPIVDDRDPPERLAPLAAFLAPVLRAVPR